uniref:Uncharacterized protein n=1 Tax=Attheya septentrionalis TaxID=420275 RepID=A0A7S2UMF1_9STRA|mmetsp:Transcript_4613/g.8194  ORF Transcript_4613/g.8194 Transcript_4613/m.8194 type:complete len:117 (+) Transcript_4613:194-544(+)
MAPYQCIATLLLALVASAAMTNVSAFTSPSSTFGIKTTTIRTSAPLFATEEEDIVVPYMGLEPANEEVKPTAVNLGFGKDGAAKSDQWDDPVMSANTQPFNISWWAWYVSSFLQYY